MNRAETYEYIEEEMKAQLGDDFESKSDVDGCEIRFEWKGDAFYRRLDVAVTSQRLVIQISAYRNLDKNKYAFFGAEIGEVLIEYDELVESLVSVAVTTLSELTVEDLFLKQKKRMMTTHINLSDEALNNGWEVPYTEVKKRATVRARSREFSGE